MSLFVYFLAISPIRFGRPGPPGDWPVSLWGQGELARATACKEGVLTGCAFGFVPVVCASVSSSCSLLSHLIHLRGLVSLISSSFVFIISRIEVSRVIENRWRVV